MVEVVLESSEGCCDRGYWDCEIYHSKKLGVMGEEEIFWGGLRAGLEEEGRENGVVGEVNNTVLIDV